MRQPPLPGLPQPDLPVAPAGTGRKAERWHAQLLKLHGERHGTTCRSCTHLERYRRANKRWLKCGQTPRGHEAGDWRAGWQACGLHAPDPGGIDVPVCATSED